MWNSAIVSPCYPVRMNNIINIPLIIPLIIHEPHIVGYIPCCHIISHNLSSNFPNTWICSRCLFSLKKIFSVDSAFLVGWPLGGEKKPSSAIQGQRKSRVKMILKDQLLGFRVLISSLPRYFSSISVSTCPHWKRPGHRRMIRTARAERMMRPTLASCSWVLYGCWLQFHPPLKISKVLVIGDHHPKHGWKYLSGSFPWNQTYSIVQ